MPLVIIKLIKKIEELFGLDLRALALMRIGFSILILLDLLNQTRFLKDFYTDQGVLPRSYLFHLLNSNAFSLHAMSGSFWFEVLLFILAGIFAVGLLVGYRTQLCTILSWILLCSLHNRNLFLLNAGDRFFHLMLFWAILLPWGACYSIDSLKEKISSLRVSSLGTVGYIFQIVFFYTFAGLLKTGHEWTTDGSALYYVLNIDQFSRPWDFFFLRFPQILKYLSFVTLYVERWAGWLLFVPFGNTYFRLLVILSFGLFQIGILSCMHLLFFQWICLVALIGLLPTPFLDRVLGPYKGELIPEQETHQSPWKLNLFRLPPYISFLAGFFIVYIFFWNMGGVEGSNAKMPPKMKWVAYLFNIDQHWGMFGPRPMDDDGWVIIPGRLRDQSIVNLKTEKAVSWPQPPSIIGYNRGHRWTVYYLYILSEKNALYRKSYADYICKEWNSTHSYEKQVLAFDIIYMKMNIFPQYKEKNAHKIVVFSQSCFDKKQPTSAIFKEGEIPN